MDKFSLFLPLLFLAIWINAAAIRDKFEFSQKELDALKNKYPSFRSVYKSFKVIDGFSSSDSKLTRLFLMIKNLCFSENGKAVGVEYKRVLVQKFSQIASSFEPWELLEQHMDIGYTFLLVSIFNKDYDSIIHRVMSLGRDEDIKSTVLPYLVKALNSGDEKLVEVARKLLFLRLYNWSSGILRQEIEKLSSESKIFSDLYERVLKADSMISLFECYMEVNSWEDPSRYISFKVYIIERYQQLNSTPIPLSIFKLVEKTRDLKPLIFHYMVMISLDYNGNLREFVLIKDFQSCSLMGVRNILTNIIVKEFSTIGVDENLIFLMTKLVTMIDTEIINLQQKQNLIKQ
jgi:hypothetical protein